MAESIGSNAGNSGAVNSEAGSSDSGNFPGSDVPTPPRGIPMPLMQETAGGAVTGSDTPTPPEGFTSLADVIGAEDVGSAAPAVFGEPGAGERTAGDTDDWPTLQYRSQERTGQPNRGTLGWLRPD